MNTSVEAVAAGVDGDGALGADGEGKGAAGVWGVVETAGLELGAGAGVDSEQPPSIRANTVTIANTETNSTFTVQSSL